MNNRHLTFTLLVLLLGCGSKPSGKNDPVLSFLFQFDNSLRTLVRCAVDGDAIKCDEGTRSPIPTLGSFQVYSGIGEWGLLKFLSSQDGCHEDKPEGKTSLELLNKLEEIGKSDSCKPVVRLADSKGNIQKEWGLGSSGRPQTAYFSGYLEPMQAYSLQIRNTEGDACKLPIRLKNEQSYSDAVINERDYGFSSGFSLHYDTAVHSTTTTVRKGDAFTYHWTPALDTAPLIAAGMSDGDVIELLHKHVEDFVVLKVSDPYGHQITCKAKDAPTGEISISGELMERLERSAGFKIVRYKVIKEEVSPTAEIIWLMTIGEYIDRTDIGGVSGGLVIKIIE